MERPSAKLYFEWPMTARNTLRIHAIYTVHLPDSRVGGKGLESTLGTYIVGVVGRRITCYSVAQLVSEYLRIPTYEKLGSGRFYKINCELPLTKC